MLGLKLNHVSKRGPNCYFHTIVFVVTLRGITRLQELFFACAQPMRDGVTVTSSLIDWVHTQNDPCGYACKRDWHRDPSLNSRHGVHPCEKVIGIFFRHKCFPIYFSLFVLVFTHNIYEVVDINSIAAEMPVKFQSDTIIITCNLAASRVREILR